MPKIATHPSSLRLRILIGIGAFFVVFVVTAALFFESERQRLLERRILELRALASIVAKAQNQFVNSGLYIFANPNIVDPGMLRQGRDRCVETLANAVERLPHVTSLGVLDTTGDLICYSEPDFVSTNFADRRYFKRVMATKEFAVGELVVDAVTEIPTLPLAFPVMDTTGEVEFILVAGRPVTWLKRSVHDLGIENGTTILVLDEAGTIFSAFPPENAQIGERAEIAERIASRPPATGTIEVSGRSGGMDVCAFRRISPQAGDGTVVACTDRGRILAELTQIQLKLFGFVFALLGGMCLTAWIGLQRFILNPLSDLATALQSIENGNQSIRLPPVRNNDEINKVIGGFNLMAASIEDREQKLSDANRELAQFSHVVSHDLKAPLRNIYALAQMLLEDLHDQIDDEPRENLNYLMKRAKRLQCLVDDLLSYFRASIDELKKENVDTNAAIEDVVRVSFEASEVDLQVDGPLPTVATDQTAFKIIMRNLIGNAIKHRTKEQTRVRVKANASPGNVTFSVIDDGPGIAPRYRQKVFQMLTTLRPRDEVEGSGMGLAIVQRAVNRMG